MRRYLSRTGQRILQARLAEQRLRVAALQREAGEAAGPSYDWHDNFGYEDARRRVEMESARLHEMVSALSGATVFSPVEQVGVVRIGSTVVVDELSGGAEREVTVGAYGESDPRFDLVSYESPLGACLLGMAAGEVATLKLDDGVSKLLVKQILPPSFKYNSILEEMEREIQERQ